MKIFIAAIILSLSSSLSFATSDLPKDITITSCGKECLEVHTRNDVVFRIYSCGKLEKKEWKELSSNKDTSGWYGTGASTAPLTIYDDPVYIDIDSDTGRLKNLNQ